MIRSPLGLRLESGRPIKDQIRAAASAGARGVILDAAGDLAPGQLSETGRREVRHALRSVEQELIALALPTRRAFDTIDQLEDRLARADRAFALAYDLGTRLVVVRVGEVPPAEEPIRREAFTTAVGELGRRADHRGIRLAVESGTERGSVLGPFLGGFGLPSLAVSLDPSALLRNGIDPVATTRELGGLIAHAYANDASKPTNQFVAANPRGYGFPAGALDWEEYLGALEEIAYRGYLTVWPEAGGDPVAQFRAIAARLAKF